MINILTLPLFDKKLKYYRKKNPFIIKDFSNLLDLLEKEPMPQNVIKLKENTFKLRMKNSSSNRGKSGGYRVYYFYKNSKDTIILFYLHFKNDEVNINEDKLIELIKKCKLELLD